MVWGGGRQPFYFATEQEEMYRCAQKWGAIAKTMFNSEAMAKNPMNFVLKFPSLINKKNVGFL